MWSRREFLKNSVIAGGLATAAGNPLEAFGNLEAGQALCILHTNDVHSRVEPFPPDDKKYPGMGGAAMRASLFEQLKKENEHTLIVDAGDIFQGTPYFNFFHGDIEIDLMNQMGYEAATIGNHDFDGGLEMLSKQIGRAHFPFVNCNYDFSDTVVAGKVHPRVIIKKGKIKIGLTGCGVELNGLVPDKLYGNTKYADPVKNVQQQVDILKHDEGCHLIICLSHLGYKYDNQKVSDIVLAQNTNHIDLIIGGHTHTFLDQPQVLQNNLGKNVVINQVGWAGLQIGKLEYFFEKNSKKNLSKSHTVIVAEKSIEK